eukprot:symbB.v1.2.015465.t1/scaffold1158.1/size134810/2
MSSLPWHTLAVHLIAVGASVWPNQPPRDIPFERSTLFTAVDVTGKFATYEAADTWYPTWGSDGKLYSPWTDGRVKDLRSSSACHDASCVTTTGFATIEGEDPMSLNITNVGLVKASTLPYHGRYPCGSLHVDGIWFYGTYALDNENHQPGFGEQMNSSRAGYCENWCIQGPFLGFRWSKDDGKTWNEPREVLKGYDDSLFGEAAPNNHSKVKFGAPHVVDLGQGLQYRPAGDNEKMMYLIGHGCEQQVCLGILW